MVSIDSSIDWQSCSVVFEISLTCPVFCQWFQVSSLRSSQSDDKKFYIYTGTKTVHLRAETRADMQDWMNVLKTAKEMFPRDSHFIGLVTPSEEITISTDKLRQKLLECGLSQEKVKECEDIMLSEFSDVKEQLRVMQQRRMTLLERLRLLEVNYFTVYFKSRICVEAWSMLWLDVELVLCNNRIQVFSYQLNT